MLHVRTKHMLIVQPQCALLRHSLLLVPFYLNSLPISTLTIAKSRWWRLAGVNGDDDNLNLNAPLSFSLFHFTRPIALSSVCSFCCSRFKRLTNIHNYISINRASLFTSLFSFARASQTNACQESINKAWVYALAYVAVCCLMLGNESDRSDNDDACTNSSSM